MMAIVSQVSRMHIKDNTLVAKNNLDLLRFIFSFIVMWEHIVALAQNKKIMYMETWFDSYSSVTGFFIISGFLIAKSYKITSDIKKYLSKRAKRLLPAYLLFVIVAALSLSVLSKFSIIEYFTNAQLLKYIVANIFFLNFLQPSLPGVFIDNPHTAVNGSLWTIKVEVLFYLSLPLVLYVVDRSRKKWITLIAIYSLSIVYRFLLVNTGNSLLDFLSRQTPGFYSYFISGISFYYYFDKYYNNKGLLFLIALPVFLLEYYVGVEVFKPICFAIIIFYLSYSFPSFNTFGKYGDFSYGIYIYHWTIIQIFVHYNLFNKFNPYYVAIILNIVVFVVALISWNYWEKRFLSR